LLDECEPACLGKVLVEDGERSVTVDLEGMSEGMWDQTCEFVRVKEREVESRKNATKR